MKDFVFMIGGKCDDPFSLTLVSERQPDAKAALVALLLELETADGRTADVSVEEDVLYIDLEQQEGVWLSLVVRLDAERIEDNAEVLEYPPTKHTGKKRKGNKE